MCHTCLFSKHPLLPESVLLLDELPVEHALAIAILVQERSMAVTFGDLPSAKGSATG